MAARLHYTKKRNTWRNNNLIKYITGLIDMDRFFMYADIPSHTLPGGGTVPPNLRVTAQKSDLVIIDRMEELLKLKIFRPRTTTTKSSTLLIK